MMINMGAYAGDIDPPQTWAALSSDSSAMLIDVRSRAEWTFVGLPDIAALGREPVLAEWATFPDMAPEARFVELLSGTLENAGAALDAPLYFLCRSGARSRHAAIAMTAAGYRQCFNIASGFEGDIDQAGHRGNLNGWKWHGLPWRQS